MKKVHKFWIAVITALLSLQSQVVAQTTTWTGDAGVWSDASMWSNGVPSKNSDVVVDALPSVDSFVSDATGTINSLTTGAGDSVETDRIRSLTISSSLANAGTILNRSSIFAGADIENSGLIEFDKVSTASLFLSSKTELTGGGTVFLSDGGVFYSPNTDVTFTNVDNLICGGGDIGWGSDSGNFTFNNQGTVDANGKNPLTILGLGSDGKINNSGLLVASDGGELTIQDVMVDNSGGTIRAEDGSEVLIDKRTFAAVEEIDLLGGTIESTGTGKVDIGGAFHDVTFNGNIETRDVEFSGSIVNTGTIRPRRTTIPLDKFALVDETQLSGGGEIHLMNERVAIDDWGDAFVNVDNTISGRGNIRCRAIHFQHGSRIAPGDPNETIPEDQMGDLLLWAIGGGPVALDGAIEVDVRVIPSDPSEIRLEYGDQDVLRAYGVASVNGPLSVSFLPSVNPVIGDFFDLVVGPQIELGPDFAFSGPAGYEFDVEVVTLKFGKAPDFNSVRVVVVDDPRIDLNPDTFVVTRGDLTFGDPTSLADSDNSDLSIQRSATDVQAVAELEMTGVSTILEPSAIDIVIESSVFARTQIDLQAEAFNYTTSSFEVIGTMPASGFVDSTQRFTLPGDTTPFVDPSNGELKARIRYSSPINRQRFAANIDHVFWSVAE